MSRKKSTLNALVHGISAGIVFGAVCGLAYYIIEPLILYKSSHAYFGVSLAGVLFVYLSFGSVLGAIAGLFVSLLKGLLRGRLSAVHADAAVFSIIGLMFSFLFIMRSHSLSHIRAFQPQLVISLAAALLIWLGIALLLSKMAAGRRKRAGGGGRGIEAAALLVIVCIAAIGIWNYTTYYRLPGRQPLHKDSPNIVLIISDALRPDHLSAYGYERDTSPHLSRMAAEGTLFSRAYAHGNRTFYSVPSIFTSLYHSETGYLWSPGKFYPLPQARITLAEMLQEAGYNTVGMITNVMLKSEMQMTQGFDRVEEFDFKRYKLSVYRLFRYLGFLESSQEASDAGRVTDKAIQWLHHMHDNPFFLLVYYMDTHHPYTPPPEYEEMFRSSKDETEANALFRKTAEFVRHPGKVVLTGGEIERLKDLYDASIRYVDEEVWRFIDALQETHPNRETIVIFTADHGDEFMEHGLVYHNNLLVEELIHVPLIMWSSQKEFEEHKVDELVRHIDLLPTIADWAGVAPPQEAEGVSLRPLINGTEKDLDLDLIAEGAESTCLLHKNWKILYVDSTDSYHLYDLSNDALGRTDVSRDHPEQYARLKKQLGEFLERARAAEEEGRNEMSPEMIEQLKALGYISPDSH